MGSPHSNGDPRRKSGTRQEAMIEIAIDISQTQKCFNQKWFWTSDDALVSPQIAHPTSVISVTDLRSGMVPYKRIRVCDSMSNTPKETWSECPSCCSAFRAGAIFRPICAMLVDEVQNDYLNQWVQQMAEEHLDQRK